VCEARGDFPTAPSAYGLNGPSAAVTVEKSPLASHTKNLTLPSGQADISTAVGIGFVRHVLSHEWLPGEFPALERLAARLEASEAFLAVPIDA